jgi:hypothetical protein
MVWNAAFLLSRSARDAFQAACGRLRSEWAPQGVILESSGPWPPYHFCPPLDLKDESHA